MLPRGTCPVRPCRDIHFRVLTAALIVDLWASSATPAIFSVSSKKTCDTLWARLSGEVGFALPGGIEARAQWHIQSQELPLRAASHRKMRCLSNLEECSHHRICGTPLPFKPPCYRLTTKFREISRARRRPAVHRTFQVFTKFPRRTRSLQLEFAPAVPNPT